MQLGCSKIWTPGTFSVSIDIPLGKITKLRNVVLVTLNLQFSGLTYSPALYCPSKTFYIY